MPEASTLQILTEKWLEAIPYLAGAAITLLSGYVAARFTARADMRKHRQSFLIERLEELDRFVYEQHSYWQFTMFKVVAQKQPRLTPDVVQRQDSASSGSARSTMLLNFYFPELKRSYDQLRSATDQQSEIALKLALDQHLPVEEEEKAVVYDNIKTAGQHNDDAYKAWIEEARKVAARILEGRR